MICNIYILYYTLKQICKIQDIPHVIQGENIVMEYILQHMHDGYHFLACFSSFPCHQKSVHWKFATKADLREVLALYAVLFSAHLKIIRNVFRYRDIETVLRPHIQSHASWKKYELFRNWIFHTLPLLDLTISCIVYGCYWNMQTRRNEMEWTKLQKKSRSVWENILILIRN